MAGRKPKPTHLKLVTSNPGKRALNATEPKPSGVLIAAPDWFDRQHKATWDHAIENAPAGLLKRLDRDVLRVWVCACVKHQVAAEQQLEIDSKPNARPLLARSRKGGYYPSPYISIGNRQAEIMMRAAGELGFTPAARTRISIDYGEGDREKDVTKDYGL